MTITSVDSAMMASANPTSQPAADSRATLPGMRSGAHSGMNDRIRARRSDPDEKAIEHHGVWFAGQLRSHESAVEVEAG